MMPDLIEFIWFFLPLFYIILIVWAFIKKIFRFFGDEPIGQYLVQFLFCLSLYLLSVYICRSDLFLSFTKFPVVNLLPDNFLKLISYPLLMLVIARYYDFKANRMLNLRQNRVR